MSKRDKSLSPVRVRITELERQKSELVSLLREALGELEWDTESKLYDRIRALLEKLD